MLSLILQALESVNIKIEKRTELGTKIYLTLKLFALITGKAEVCPKRTCLSSLIVPHLVDPGWTSPYLFPASTPLSSSPTPTPSIIILTLRHLPRMIQGLKCHRQITKIRSVKKRENGEEGSMSWVYAAFSMRQANKMR